MDYNHLIAEAKRDIPEFSAQYDGLVKKDVIDKNTGVHIIFSLVFVPLVLKAVKDNNIDLKNKCFNFIEEMAESKDKLVSEVCDFTVMEELHDIMPDEELKPLLGRESLQSLSVVSGYMNSTEEMA